MSRAVMLGLYGKLPSHGDFLRRRVPDPFLAAWDPWLQESIARSRSALGEKWLELFLTSPVWRFACSPGACGPAPMVGLIAPSVDKVGRYFPFTLMSELSPADGLCTAIRQAEPLLAAAEQLLVETLESEPLDFNLFDARLVSLSHELGPPVPGLRLDSDQARAIVNTGRVANWQIPLGAPQHLGLVFEQLLSLRLSTLHDPFSIWWSEGSSMVEPCCLLVKGLPSPQSFSAMLDGSWRQANWDVVHVDFDEPADPGDDTVVPPPLELRYRSAAKSDAGQVRRVNQDAYLERSTAGLWVVADGIGGYSDGDVASRMVCDRLADLVPHPDFEQTIELARRALGEVNTHLHRKSIQAENAVRSGSTVVALFTRGARCAVVWAGDSRLYRWRAGQLEQLTRDHSVAAEEPGPHAAEEANAITRAVGGEQDLELDVRYDRVETGDRFLLCTDGLSKVLPEEALRRWVAHASIAEAVDGLVADTQAAGAPDNVTALIVEALSEPASP